MAESRLARSVLQLALLIALLGFVRWARANDTVFGGSAAELVPLQETEVQMRTEDIVLTAHPTQMRWDVEARYEFVNHGASAARLQVGFPEFRCSKDDENCAHVSFRNLSTLVDGKPVKHRQGALGEGHEWKDHLGVIWLFDVTFPPGKPVTIVHSYSVPGGAVSDGMRFASYVTRTGATWAKTIEKARFTMRLPPFTHSVRAVDAKGLVSQPPRVAADGHIELVAEGANWVPVADLEFAFNASSMRTEAFGCTGFVRDEKAQDCINWLYAAKGYPFKSKQLAEPLYSGDHAFKPTKHLGPGWWARKIPSQPGFRTEWFEPWEQRLLRELEKTAKEYRASQGKGTTDPAEQLPALPSASPSAGRGLAVLPTPSAVARTKPTAASAPALPPAASGASKQVAPSEPPPRKRTTLCQISSLPFEPAGTPVAWLALGAAIVWRRRRIASGPTE